TSLSASEQNELYQVLLRYKDHLTTRPGKCNLFTYRFQVNADKPIVSYSRPIPFALRPAVREQIQQIIEDGILEFSTSPVLNPLDGSEQRSLNPIHGPDHERTTSINALLQRFHGAR
ncbi:hypothetical protein B7P43_G19008, partial [Cryptotermes secundus]